jgi:hypothetical protein
MMRCPGDSYIQKPRGKRQVGRPRARWLDEVDARELGIIRWWIRALDKGEWRRRLLKEAKTLKEL